MKRAKEQYKFTRPESVMNSALGSLDYKEHTVSELREKLLTKTENEEWVESAIKRCIEYGYLKTDEKFALAFADSRFRSFYGSRRIFEDLKKKGISEDVAWAGIQQAMEQGRFHDDKTLILRLSEKKDLSKTTREKLYQEMRKYGFSSGAVTKALSERDDSGKLLTKAQMKGAKADLESEILKLYRKGKGAQLIQSELRSKHIDTSEFSEVLGELELSEKIDFYNACKEAILKKRFDLKTYEGKQKAFSYGMRRGFNPEQIKYAIEEGEH